MSTVPQQMILEQTSNGLAKVDTIVRILLGAFLAFSALSFWLQLAPQPEMPVLAQNFFAALAQSGYFLPLLKMTELVVALALLTNRFVPLALVVLAPITVNVVLFHVVLAPGGMAAGLLLVALHLALAWSRRRSFSELLKIR